MWQQFKSSIGRPGLKIIGVASLMVGVLLLLVSIVGITTNAGSLIEIVCASTIVGMSTALLILNFLWQNEPEVN